MGWALTIIFILGIANFTMQRAVLESGHPIVNQMRELMALGGQRFILVLEFAVLLGALLLAANGWPAIAWAYLAYSALNAITAWLILTGRV